MYNPSKWYQILVLPHGLSGLTEGAISAEMRLEKKLKEQKKFHSTKCKTLGMWFIYDLILKMIMCSESNLEDYLLYITVVKKSFFSCILALWENGWFLALIS